MLISYRDTTDTLRNISQGQMHRCSGMHLLLGKQILYFLLYDHQVNVGQQVINSSNIFLFHLGTSSPQCYNKALKSFAIT